MEKLNLAFFCAVFCACTPLDAEVISKKAMVQSYEDLDGLIEAGGYFVPPFDPYFRDFKKNCPTSDEDIARFESAETEFFLVTFSRQVETTEILLYFRQNYLRAAGTIDLLRFGTVFSDDPEGVPGKIVSLGEECLGESRHIFSWGNYYPNARIARYNKNFRELGIIFSDGDKYGERWWIWSEGHETIFLAFKDD